MKEVRTARVADKTEMKIVYQKCPNIEEIHAVPFWDNTTGTIVLIFNTKNEKENFLKRVSE